MKQPKVYRTPKDPGYVGGYNWSSLTAGLLLLIVTNVAATQFIAYRFRYQPALGTPLASIHGHAVYQPIRWAWWVWKHGSSANPQVRQPILLGALIVIVGAGATLAVVYALNIRKTRRLSQNTEDIHGSARWATAADVRATGLLGSPQGVYVGGWYEDSLRRLHYLRHNGPEHILAFAPTRSGKGVGLVIPSLLAWSESCVVYDIKGENWAKTAGYRSRAGTSASSFRPSRKAMAPASIRLRRSASAPRGMSPTPKTSPT